MPSGFSVTVFSSLLLTLAAGDAWSDIPQYVMFDGHIDISAREGSIISHSGFNNGQDYPHRYDATATFINLPAEITTNLTLYFVKFEVEHDPPCDDYLLVDGTRYCGKGLNGMIKRYQIRASSFTLTFHTDWIHRDVGFKIQFTVTTPITSTQTAADTTTQTYTTQSSTRSGTSVKSVATLDLSTVTGTSTATQRYTTQSSTLSGTSMKSAATLDLSAVISQSGSEGGKGTNTKKHNFIVIGTGVGVPVAVVVISLLVVVLVQRRRRLNKSQEAQHQPGPLGLTQSNHDAANHIYGNMSDPTTDQTADQYTSVTLTAGAAEDTHVYADLQADHYTLATVTAREGDTHVYTDLQAVHSPQRPY